MTLLSCVGLTPIFLVGALHVASVDLVIECIPAYVYKTGIKLHFHLQVHSYHFSSQTFLSYCYRNGCI